MIEAALLFDLQTERKVLIEATSNQVNQFGGYTGMKPDQFRDFVLAIADKVGFPHARLILGGDHLGPNCWQGEDAESALLKSEVLIEQYVRAGFTKIHIDTSMSCADDPVPLLPVTVAQRAAASLPGGGAGGDRRAKTAHHLCGGNGSAGAGGRERSHQVGAYHDAGSGDGNHPDPLRCLR
ncbi:putative tagatose 6-phosphate kinase [Atlantibacter hermannii]|nr:putative tagatose 6-phosphate kinase [Atlantibacter hermannii]